MRWKLWAAAALLMFGVAFMANAAARWPAAWGFVGALLLLFVPALIADAVMGELRTEWRSGAHVLSTTMTDGYEPPSTSLVPPKGTGEQGRRGLDSLDVPKPHAVWPPPRTGPGGAPVDYDG